MISTEKVEMGNNTHSLSMDIIVVVVVQDNKMTQLARL